MKTTGKKSAWITPQGKIFKDFESHEGFAFNYLVKSEKLKPAEHAEIMKKFNGLSEYLIFLGWCKVQDLWYANHELLVYPEKVNILQQRTLDSYLV